MKAVFSFLTTYIFISTSIFKYNATEIYKAFNILHVAFLIWTLPSILVFILTTLIFPAFVVNPTFPLRSSIYSSYYWSFIRGSTSSAKSMSSNWAVIIQFITLLLPSVVFPLKVWRNASLIYDTTQIGTVSFPWYSTLHG